MKHIVRKMCWDYEKEEAWLNGMSAKGMALVDYSWCRYVFADAPDNDYTYRIELLDKMPTHPESIAYLRFLEENGVECVATYMRWIYLRKKTVEGAFDLYSDLESKITHYKRIQTIYLSTMWVEFMAGFANVSIGLISLGTGNSLGNASVGNLIIGFSLMMLGFVFYKLGEPLRKKIRKLQIERTVRE